MNDIIVIECDKCGKEITPHIKYSLLGAPYVKCQACNSKYILTTEQLTLIKKQ